MNVRVRQIIVEDAVLLRGLSALFRAGSITDNVPLELERISIAVFRGCR